jgi:TonB family protein
MSPRLQNFVGALLVSLPLISFSQTSASKSVPSAAPKSSVQLRAEALFDRARALSDIRSQGSPAFRLKATFTFQAKDLSTAEGSYNEVWLSPTAWWRETIAGDSRRVEVGGLNRIWRLDSATDLPSAAAEAPNLVRLLPASFDLSFESVRDDTVGNNTVECAITQTSSDGWKSAFCFEKKSGALFQKVSPERRPKNSVSVSCLFGIYRPFGKFQVPREAACFEEKHHKIDLKVAELDLDPSPDTALFQPPKGAIEIGDCTTHKTPPVPVHQAEPHFPQGQPNSAIVTLAAIVDSSGKVEKVRVENSGGKDFDASALAAINQWEFKPATCDGQPIPVEIKIEVDMRAPGLP